MTTKNKNNVRQFIQSHILAKVPFMNNNTQLTDSSCPKITSIADFIDNTLPQDKRNEFMEHLSSCPICYEVFTESTVQVLEKNNKSFWINPKSFSIAASVIIVVLVSFYTFTTDKDIQDPFALNIQLSQMDNFKTAKIYEYSRIRGFALINEKNPKIKTGILISKIQLLILKGDTQKSYQTLIQLIGLLETYESIHLEYFINLKNDRDNLRENVLDSLQKSPIIKENDKSILFGSWLETMRVATILNSRNSLKENDIDYFLHQTSKMTLNNTTINNLKKLKSSLNDKNEMNYEEITTVLTRIINSY